MTVLALIVAKKVLMTVLMLIITDEDEDWRAYEER